ncbi:MAG: GDSL-type esterase/lipase family protein, partial [Bacilli bacterium]|nr:GDSL-type esterase/lipase family protein [Bacilli bacterium]
IGVNDVWHGIFDNNGTSLPKFKKTYRAMLDDIKDKLPNIKLMIMEPFVLHGRITDLAYDQFEEVYKYAKAAKRIAKEYNALFIPLQKIMDKAAIKYGADNLLYDGVHPHALGAKIIADAWIKAYKKL